jgi:hypothetical protein
MSATTSHTRVKHHVAKVNYDADSILELLAVYRLARDLAKSHGFPDWGKMWFHMELEFTSLGKADAEMLKRAAKDLDLALRVSEEEI